MPPEQGANVKLFFFLQKIGKNGPGGVAQCTSHPPQEEDPDSNPAREKVFLGKQSNCCMHCLRVEKIALAKNITKNWRK
jgi:hypothetical protein